jgi:hypothetical protein
MAPLRFGVAPRNRPHTLMAGRPALSIVWPVFARPPPRRSSRLMAGLGGGDCRARPHTRHSAPHTTLEARRSRPGEESGRRPARWRTARNKLPPPPSSRPKDDHHHRPRFSPAGRVCVQYAPGPVAMEQYGEIACRQWETGAFVQPKFGANKLLLSSWPLMMFACECVCYRRRRC